MRIAVLVKQVPRFDEMQLGADGRLLRDGLELELNPYCRRAVSKGVELAAETGGTATVVTLGPPTAEDVLREAIAWGIDDGILVTDPAFAGSDTLATARALAAVLRREGPFDLILVGRNSVDADTGQVGPQVAQLLDLPFATGVKRLDLGDTEVKVLCEEDDGSSERIVQLPAVLSAAERLIEPAKVDADGRAAVPASRIRTLTAAELGPGPWGEAGSGTTVGQVRMHATERARIVLSGTPAEQVDQAVRFLIERGALAAVDANHASSLVATHTGGPTVAVVAEPGRSNVTAELLGAGNILAAGIRGQVVVVTAERTGDDLAALGADAIVQIDGAAAEEDVATGVEMWAAPLSPWAILLPSTTWGREVGSRLAIRLGAGLTGDAIGFDLSGDHEPRLLAWKPAFGGQLVAAISCTTPVQMATVRPGVLPRPRPRATTVVPTATIEVAPRRRVQVLATSRDDDVDRLAAAPRIVCVGAGVSPEHYGALDPLLQALGAELAATRKVTDKGWQPRARQIGITGRSVAPRLYVGIGLSGKFNHAIGVRAAGTVLAINSDPDALIWDHCDVGIVGDWQGVVPVLAAALESRKRSLGSI